MLLFRSESQHRIMGQPSLLLNEYKLKLTILLHIAPQLTIIGAKMLLILYIICISTYSLLPESVQGLKTAYQLSRSRVMALTPFHSIPLYLLIFFISSSYSCLGLPRFSVARTFWCNLIFSTMKTRQQCEKQLKVATRLSKQYSVTTSHLNYHLRENQQSQLAATSQVQRPGLPYVCV